MPLRLIFDGQTIVDSYLAERDKEVAKLIIDMRGHLDPATMQNSPAVIQQNTAQIDAAFQRAHPGVARVLVFRATTSPAQRTARHVLGASGYVLQLLVKKNSTVVAPVSEVTDRAVAVVFPYTTAGVSSTPLIFIGDVSGNQSAVTEVHDAMLAHAVTLESAISGDDYTPPSAAEYAVLVAAATGNLRGSSPDHVPRAELEALRAELVACNKRRMALEMAVDTLQRNVAAVADTHNAAMADFNRSVEVLFAACVRSIETVVADARRNNATVVKLLS